MRVEHDLLRLPNGLTLAVAPMPHLESVSMGLWVRAGGRHEPAVRSGAAHFIEHLVFKGTPTRSARAISRAIEGRGGHVNAFTQEDSTCYYAQVAADRSREVFEILADIFLRARLAGADVEHERAVILDEIAMYRDQPASRVQELLDEALWSGHPLGRAVTGSERSVARMTAGELRAYKDRVYVPANTIVTVAGRLDPGEWVAQVRGLFGRRHAGVPAPARPVTAATPRRELAVEEKAVEQTQFAFGFRCFGRHDPRRFGLRLLSIILGETMSSRLFHRIREKLGLAYSIQSEIRLFADTGALVVDAGLDPDRAPRALRLIFDELLRLRESPVTAAELRLAKDYAAGQIKIGLESSGSRMNWLGENLAAYDRIVQPVEIIAALRAVTAGDLRDLARHLLQPARFSAALIAPAPAASLAAEVRRQVRRL